MGVLWLPRSIQVTTCDELSDGWSHIAFYQPKRSFRNCIYLALYRGEAPHCWCYIICDPVTQPLIHKEMFILYPSHIFPATSQNVLLNNDRKMLFNRWENGRKRHKTYLCYAKNISLLLFAEVNNASCGVNWIIWKSCRKGGCWNHTHCVVVGVQICRTIHKHQVLGDMCLLRHRTTYLLDQHHKGSQVLLYRPTPGVLSSLTYVTWVSWKKRDTFKKTNPHFLHTKIRPLGSIHNFPLRIILMIWLGSSAKGYQGIGRLSV